MFRSTKDNMRVSRAPELVHVRYCDSIFLQEIYHQYYSSILCHVSLTWSLGGAEFIGTSGVVGLPPLAQPLRYAQSDPSSCSANSAKCNWLQGWLGSSLGKQGSVGKATTLPGCYKPSNQNIWLAYSHFANLIPTSFLSLVEVYHVSSHSLQPVTCSWATQGAPSSAQRFHCRCHSRCSVETRLHLALDHHQMGPAQTFLAQ